MFLNTIIENEIKSLHLFTKKVLHVSKSSVIFEV